MPETRSSVVRDPSRLAVLRRTGLLDSAADEAFDRITRLATRVLGVPTALISLVGADRQFFTSACGLPEPWASRRETPVEYSFCRHVVESGAPFIVEDARVDPRVNDSPLIAEMQMIAYAGIPLITREGHRLGSFCVVDAEPRRWTDAELAALGELAGLVADQIENRLAAAERTEELTALLERERLALAEAEAERQRFRAVQEASPDGFMLLASVRDAEGRIIDFEWTYTNPAAERIVGRTHAELCGRRLLVEMPGNREEELFEAYVQVVESGAPWQREFAYRHEGLDHAFRAVAVRVGDGFGVSFGDISARVRAEQEARRRGALLDQSNDAVAVWRPGGIIAYWNAAAASLYGYSAEEAIGRCIQELLHTRWTDGTASDLERTLRSRGRWEGELTHKARDGRSLVVQSRQVLVRGDDGPDEVLETNRDVTEERSKDEAIRSSERHLRHVLDSLPVYVGVLSPDGRLTHANRAALQGVGARAEDVIGRPFVETPWWANAEDRARFEAAMVRACAGLTSRFDVRLPLESGDEAVMDFTLTPMLDASGAVTHLIPSAIDITERIRATAAVRENEARYRRFFEDDISGNYVADRDGRILQCNPAFLRMFGFGSMEEALQSTMDSLHVNLEQRTIILRRVREDGRAELQELEMRQTDGTPVHVIKNVIGVFDADGEVVGTRGYLVDITDRKALEEQLRQSQKLEAVGQLAGGVAHDFNNMLTAISGHAQLLLGELPENSAMREDLLEIWRAADRSAALTRQLLAFSRKQILQPQVVSLGAIVSGMEGLLRRLIGEHIEIVTHLSPTDEAHVDPGQMEQVVLNLAVNARDAMPDGGTLLIETRSVHVDGIDERLHAAGIAPGRYAILTVRDSGCGMDDEVLSHIFEPFYTTKEVGKGTGLGLSTVYGIVRQSGGYIVAESEPGRGSTLTVFLPLVGSAAGAAGETEAEGEVARPGSGTVLVVEDEVSVRGLVTRLLRRAGYSVLEAEGGAEAIRIAEAHAGEIDLLLTDVVMPGISGTVVAERLGRAYPRMRVLFMSGYSEEAIAHHGVLDPGTRLLQKPFAPADLLRMVEGQLRQRERP